MIYGSNLSAEIAVFVGFNARDAMVRTAAIELEMVLIGGRDVDILVIFGGPLILLWCCPCQRRASQNQRRDQRLN